MRMAGGSRRAATCRDGDDGTRERDGGRGWHRGTAGRLPRTCCQRARVGLSSCRPAHPLQRRGLVRPQAPAPPGPRTPRRAGSAAQAPRQHSTAPGSGAGLGCARPRACRPRLRSPRPASRSWRCSCAWGTSEAAHSRPRGPQATRRQLRDPARARAARAGNQRTSWCAAAACACAQPPARAAIGVSPVMTYPRPSRPSALAPPGRRARGPGGRARTLRVPAGGVEAPASTLRQRVSGPMPKGRRGGKAGGKAGVQGKEGGEGFARAGLTSDFAPGRRGVRGMLGIGNGRRRRRWRLLRGRCRRRAAGLGPGGFRLGAAAPHGATPPPRLRLRGECPHAVMLAAGGVMPL